MNEYGIFQEKFDSYRAHVSVVTGKVYFFQVVDCLMQLIAKSYREVSAYTGDMETAIGRLVPPGDIPGLKEYPIPEYILRKARDTWSTSKKGRFAIYIVRRMLEKGIISIPKPVVVVTDEMSQIKGLDLVVRFDVEIQVKLDWSAGPKKEGGTGNLFIQTHERNPYNQY